MQIRYIPALVMLIAGAVGCITGILNNYDTSYMMKMEIAVMIIFFFIGQLAKRIISIVVIKHNEEQEKNDEVHEQTESIDDNVQS